MANKREGHGREAKERVAFPLWALASGQYPLPLLACAPREYHQQVAAQLLLCVSQHGGGPWLLEAGATLSAIGCSISGLPGLPCSYPDTVARTQNCGQLEWTQCWALPVTPSLAMGKSKPFSEFFPRETRSVHSETIPDKRSLWHGSRAGGCKSQMESPRLKCLRLAP